MTPPARTLQGQNRKIIRGQIGFGGGGHSRADFPTGSVITKTTASALGLVPVSRTKVRGVHGVQEVNVYYVNITLNNEEITLTTSVTECDELSADHSVGLLIGMNIITMGDFSITNYGGNTVMTFRRPSLESIDYVKEINEHNRYLKIHQIWLKKGNNKCPCNSGKIWDNCHGKSKY